MTDDFARLERSIFRLVGAIHELPLRDFLASPKKVMAWKNPLLGGVPERRGG